MNNGLSTHQPFAVQPVDSGGLTDPTSLPSPSALPTEVYGPARAPRGAPVAHAPTATWATDQPLWCLCRGSRVGQSWLITRAAGPALLVVLDGQVRVSLQFPCEGVAHAFAAAAKERDMLLAAGWRPLQR